MRKPKKKKRGNLILNAAGLTIAVVLFGYALSANAPALFAQAAKSSLAAVTVSVSAGVPANPDNTLAQELQEKEAQLDQQQQQIDQAQESGGALFGSIGFYSLLASIALFILVGANFYFDWRRSRRGAIGGQPLYVDLRTGK